MALLLHKYWESALKKSSCLYWWCLVKKSPNLCPLIIVSQRCCHSMEEAEILSTSGRTWKKQGKEGLEGTYYFGFIAKWNETKVICSLQSLFTLLLSCSSWSREYLSLFHTMTASLRNYNEWTEARTFFDKHHQ